MQITVIGSFETFGEAAKVAETLRAAGFLDSDVNIIAHDTQRTSPADGELGGAADSDDQMSGVKTGAVAGVALGGVAGLAASLAGLAIPGIGPIIAAGPIVSALAGAGAGAMTGGLIGGLVDLGISKSDAENYAEAVRRGGALVTVRADASRVDMADAIIRGHGAYDIDDRVEQWKKDGWIGHNPTAGPDHDECQRRTGPDACS